ncbi:MAG: shikimate kinase [Elusimicrobiota bacterium]|nr:shikimate kinase [Elusimicrobiota bacterium]
MNIVLTGFMCTGKTSVGKKLAEKLNYEYIDTDEIIIKRTGLEITEIFARYGEPYFRDIESQVVKEVSKLDKKIIATGGGVVLRKENVDNLRNNGVIINLTAKPETIFERLQKQPGVRPLLNKPEPFEEIKKLLNQREEFYKNCDIRIETDNLPVDEIVEIIIDYINKKK